MPSQEPQAKSKSLFVFSLILLATASFMVIPFISFVYRPYFAYYNGSDEQIYLTYQGALALLNDRSRGMSSKLVVLFHELGWSGAALNLLMDLAAPLAIFGMSVYALKKLLPEKECFKAAWLIVFGSVLFNQSNPMLRSLLPDFRYSDTTWISAFEGFAPFIRTPEPQLSICLALLAVLAFLRFRFKALLILPLPFLYDSVMMSYIYLLSIFLARTYLIGRPTIYTEMLVNLSVVIALSGALGIADQFGLFNNIADIATHYRHTHMPAISIGLLIAIGTLAFQFLRLRNNLQQITPWDSATVAVAFLQLFLTNHSIISGVSIFPQALQSVGGTFGSAFMAFAILRLLRWNHLAVENISFVLLSFYILFCINYSQGLKISSRYYRIQLFHDISNENLEYFKNNPLGYVSGSQLFKGYIGLAYPKQIIPPMAHFYNFPFYMAACKELADINLKAVEYTENNIDNIEFKRDPDNTKREIAAIRQSAANVMTYREKCPVGIPEAVQFKIYPVKNDTMVLIRLWPLGIERQGVDF